MRCKLPPKLPVSDLLTALQQCGDRLNAWLNQSPDNVQLYMQDPLAALQAADPHMDFNVMLELETVLSGLARKLDQNLPLCMEKVPA